MRAPAEQFAAEHEPRLVEPPQTVHVLELRAPDHLVTGGEVIGF
jgi:hypothetical protein